MTTAFSYTLSKVNTIFTTAKMCGWNQTKILEVLNSDVHSVLAEKQPSGRAKFTKADKAYIQGYIAAKFDAIVKHETAYYYNIGGKYYAAHKRDATESIPHYYDVFGHNFVADAKDGAIYWKNTDKKYS